MVKRKILLHDYDKKIVLHFSSGEHFCFFIKTPIFPLYKKEKKPIKLPSIPDNDFFSCEEMYMLENIFN